MIVCTCIYIFIFYKSKSMLFLYVLIFAYCRCSVHQAIGTVKRLFQQQRFGSREGASKSRKWQRTYHVYIYIQVKIGGTENLAIVSKHFVYLYIYIVAISVYIDLVTQQLLVNICGLLAVYYPRKPRWKGWSVKDIPWTGRTTNIHCHLLLQYTPSSNQMMFSTSRWCINRSPCQTLYRELI